MVKSRIEDIDMYFAVWATDHEGTLPVRLAVRDAHRARLRDPSPHRVKVLVGGPTSDVSGADMNGSLFVIEADGIDTVTRFMAEDPYELSGVYASVVIRPWQWSLGAPSCRGSVATMSSVADQQASSPRSLNR
jgi:uncharacterized protein YciI